jgi:hypothetical protein
MFQKEFLKKIQIKKKVKFQNVQIFLKKIKKLNSRKQKVDEKTPKTHEKRTIKAKPEKIARQSPQSGLERS